MPPLFERVDSTDVPDHIANETDPAKINQYWADREKQLRQELTPGPITTNNPPRTPTTIGNPSGMSAGQAATLIAGAKMVAQQGKEHWSRFLPEVETIMDQMTPEQRMDANMWNTVYDKVVGMHVQDLVRESREAALRPPSMESSTAGNPNPEPRQLSHAELHVVDQLRRAGVTALKKDAAGNVTQVPFDSEAYISADERRQKGAWPLTFSNY